MSKKRILFCSEATYLNTGFSTYYNELMRKLHQTGKYELAELATYGDTSNPEDTRWMDVPWKFYPVLPNRASQREADMYNSDRKNEFGRWKFEATLIDFQPAVCVSCRDWWMDDFINRSCLRQYFRYAKMVCIDGAPLQDEWVDDAQRADAIFSYSDWGLEQLRKRGKCNILGETPPGVDFDVFRPMDKFKHKESLGLDPNSFIVGMVARNQRRKLFPALFDAFSYFLEKGSPEITKRTYLYLHTSLPDLGWDIARLLKETGLGHKVIFTYICRSCNCLYPSFFQDTNAICRNCNNQSAYFPNFQAGASREILAKIYNLFDCYVQYASLEGSGIPQLEAAACGVHVFAVDHSAMSDVIRKIKGTPIKVDRLHKEVESHRDLAIPNNKDFAEKLESFLKLPKSMKARKSFETNKAVKQYYNWEKTTNRWMEYFDSCELAKPWIGAASLHTPNMNIPQLDNYSFVKWCVTHIGGRPDLANNYITLKMIKDLNFGATMGPNNTFHAFTREMVIDICKKVLDERNHWEQARGNLK